MGVFAIGTRGTSIRRAPADQGDNTLEGNEESLETFYQDVLIDQLRHAVRSGGKMSEQRVPFSVRAEARDGLADWWADRFDQWFFNQLTGNTAISDERYYGFNAPTAPDADHITYHASGSTAEVSLSATSVAKLSLTTIDYADEKAKMAKNTIKPVRVGGKDYFVMKLEEAGVACYEFGPDGRTPRQTPRPSIALRDAILPWISFN